MVKNQKKKLKHTPQNQRRSEAKNEKVQQV